MMTKYEKIRKELHEALAEFTRLTGTGNVKLANLVMIQIIHFLVDLVEHQPKTSCQCGGQCGTVSMPLLAPAPITVLPVQPTEDSDMVRLIEPVKSEEVEPQVLEQVSEVPVQDDEPTDEPTPEQEELVSPKPKRGRRT